MDLLGAVRTFFQSMCQFDPATDFAKNKDMY